MSNTENKVIIPPSDEENFDDFESSGEGRIDRPLMSILRL